MTEADEDAFRELLRRRHEEPERAEEIDAEIRRRFETEAAVLITDSVGFTRRTREKGILHVLSLLLHHAERLRPVLLAHGARVVKEEADNLFAVFSSVSEALAAARAMRDELAAYNRAVEPERQVRICTGIGFGRVILLPGDAFGDAVNLASKLGEDTAEAEEILLTEEARAQVADEGHRFEPRSVEAATNLVLRYYAYLGPAGGAPAGS